jgi:hypothetical protein
MSGCLLTGDNLLLHFYDLALDQLLCRSHVLYRHPERLEQRDLLGGEMTTPHSFVQVHPRTPLLVALLRQWLSDHPPA